MDISIRGTNMGLWKVLKACNQALDGTRKFLTAYHYTLDTTSKEIETQSNILRNSAHKNGSAKTKMVAALGTIDEILEDARKDVKPKLKERFSPEWRKKIELEAWITYLMSQRKLFNMDFNSPVALDGRLARRSGFYHETFNCAYRIALNSFAKTAQDDVQKLQQEGVAINPDSTTIKKVTNKKLIEFLFGKLDLVMYRCDIEPCQINNETRTPEFPFGISKFHVISYRINHIISDLRNSDDPEDKKQYLDYLTTLREKEIRAYEKKALKEAEKVGSVKSSLGTRDVSLERMLFLLEKCAIPVNEQYAQNARGDANDKFKELALFNPDRQFYKNAIYNMISDIEPFQEEDLPNLNVLLTYFTNISEAIEFVAKKAQLNSSTVYGYYEKFLRQVEWVTKEALRSTKSEIMEAAEDCDDETVDELLEKHKVLCAKWKESFPDTNLELDLTEEINQAYGDNLARRLDSFEADILYRFMNLDFRGVPELAQAYQDIYHKSFMYIPDDLETTDDEFEPTDIEELAKSEIERIRVESPKNIIKKRDEFYAQAENAFHGNNFGELRESTDQYVALCETFPEDCGPARLEDIQEMIYKKTQDAKDRHDENFSGYAKVYLQFSCRYFDGPNTEHLKNLDIKYIPEPKIMKLKITNIKRKNPDSD